ncbi:MAG: TIGR00153 family protein [Wenzhouxiangellaceae bacterium]|nr:TIGR00153 family protein [Wenzhouxiangellaceae bacterium]
MTRFEDAADDLKQEFRLNPPKSMFMPVSRSDLLDLISMQDRIANKAKDISGLVIGRKMQLPEPLAESYLDLLRSSLRAVAQAQKSVAELDELFEAGFRGQEVDLVMAMTEELGRIESEADRMQIELRAQLFRIEKDLPPVEVMFLYRIFELTGDLGDLAQGVGGRLHLIISG